MGSCQSSGYVQNWRNYINNKRGTTAKKPLNFGEADDDNYFEKPTPDPVDENLSLSSVGGLESHIRYLKRAIMYPLMHVNALKEWGIDPPKGIMFYGPPGTGKTLLAKALVSELSKFNPNGEKVSFFYHKGTESDSKWFGESEMKLRNLFNAAMQHKPSVIFFDEIDGLCPNRDSSKNSGNGRQFVVTALLGLIDSVKRGEVFIIGATNRLDSVDPAIRRPGRFDKELAFGLPEEAGRKTIIGIHTRTWSQKDKPQGIFLDELAKSTQGFTGADLEKLVRDTIIEAMSRPENKDLQASEVDILREHWATAIQNMHPSNTSNVFESALYITEPLASSLRPLVSNIIAEILTNIRPLLSIETRNSLTNTVFRNTFLLYDENPVSEEYLNSIIAKGILGDPSISKFNTFLLNDETIFNQMKTSTLIGSVGKIIDQVINSSKPAILFIPRLDSLHDLMRGSQTRGSNYLHSFYNQILRINGPNTLVLATATFPLSEFPKEIKQLFFGGNRFYKLRDVNIMEIMAFFAQEFESLLNPGTGDEQVSKRQKTEKNPTENELDFKNLLDQTVQMTQGDHVEDIFRLHSALRTHNKASGNDRQRIYEGFQRILENYGLNKLQS